MCLQVCFLHYFSSGGEELLKHNSAVLCSTHNMLFVTGGDCTSAFRGIGKLTAWDSWKRHPDTFNFISPSRPFDIPSTDAFRAIENFVVSCYCPSSTCETVNEERQHSVLCGKKVREIPPSKVTCYFLKNYS